LASRREQYTADKFISLFGELVKRDLRKKYRRSVLGYFWSLLNPLMTMAVMMVVFSYMFRFEIENYPLYLICGQTMFNFFNESTNMSLYSIIDNGILLKKIYVPKYVFPISRVLSCFVTMSMPVTAR
jgi:ABC-2 type transport system permease protein